MDLRESFSIIKYYVNDNINIFKYIDMAKECKYDDLLMAKLFILEIYLLEYIFVFMFYNHNFICDNEDEHDFHYKLDFSINFLNLKIKNVNLETIEIDSKLLIIFRDILQRYENVQNYVNNNV
jgi:hypothetical protein